MNKEEVDQMSAVIRLKEFAARKTLNKEENIGENEKMILSKLFVTREYIADMVRLNKELNNREDEELYRILLEGFDIQLRIYFSYLFKEEAERCDNCIKRLKFNTDEVFDLIAGLAGESDYEEYYEKIENYFTERYGDGSF
jgi:CRISPR/Cas system CSM-associated protein Csm4 (group 5 of RAMP superfamily)